MGFWDYPRAPPHPPPEMGTSLNLPSEGGGGARFISPGRDPAASLPLSRFDFSRIRLGGRAFACPGIFPAPAAISPPVTKPRAAAARADLECGNGARTATRAAAHHRRGVMRTSTVDRRRGRGSPRNLPLEGSRRVAHWGDLPRNRLVCPFFFKGQTISAESFQFGIFRRISPAFPAVIQGKATESLARSGIVSSRGIQPQAAAASCVSDPSDR